MPSHGYSPTERTIVSSVRRTVPRLRRWHGTTDQLGQVRELLAGDPDCRQAVVQLFDPSDPWSLATKDR